MFNQPRKRNGRYHFKSRAKSIAKFIGIMTIVYIVFMVANFFIDRGEEKLAESNIVLPTVTREVKAEDTIPPILKKIAVCESNNKHFDKNGQVLINKTQDIGRYMINVPIWGKKATELGYNLAVEKDNEAFALFLFQNYGSEPWYLVASCFKKLK